MYCKNCGTWCSDGDEICSACGCRLPVPAAVDPAADQPWFDAGGNPDQQWPAAQDMPYGSDYEDPYGQNMQYDPYDSYSMQQDPCEQNVQSDPYDPYPMQQNTDEQEIQPEPYYTEPIQPDPYMPEGPEMPDYPDEPEQRRGLKGTTIAAIILAVLLIAVSAVIAVVVIRQGGGIKAEEEAAQQEAMTAEITSFAADSTNATAVSMTIEGSGHQPAGWKIELTPESGPTISEETTERSVIIDGLTPETNYTAVLKAADDTVLTGITECSFTTGEYTVLTFFQADSVAADQASLSWDWTGTSPSWTVTWDGSDGSSDSLETTDDFCTITGLTIGVSYTVKLSCDSLKSAELATITVTPQLLAVAGWNITDLSSTSVSVSWDYSGTDTVPAQWTLCYSCGDAEPVTLDTTTNSGVVVSDLLPNTTYTFSVAAADGAAVDSEQTAYTTSNGGTFSEYGCCDVSMTLYALDNESDSLDDPTTVLSTSQFLGYQIEASYDVTYADKTVDTLYIIRKSDGTPLYTYSSTRSWGGDWQIADHTGSFPDHITEPGDYTLEAYFDGCFMASERFTVQ